MKKIIVLFLFLMSMTMYGYDGKDIMKKVDERDNGTTRKFDLKMTLIDKNGSKRTRELVSLQKSYGKDSKNLMKFISPLDVKDTSYLSWEYDNSSKEDSRWLYMPALRKTRRINGSSGSDYFMGTDFSYNDMGDKNINDNTYQIIKEEKVNGYDCWVLEAMPKNENEEYTKKILWVKKDVDIVVKTEYYNSFGLLKVLNIKKIEKINDIWTVTEMLMENIQNKHKTILEMKNYAYNQGVSDKDFSVSNLEKN